MPFLTIRQEEQTMRAAFTGTPLLSAVLQEAGFAVPAPCGGRGQCGKCAVLALEGDVSAPTAQERSAGKRLACQARLRGDCSVCLPGRAGLLAVETDAADSLPSIMPMPGAVGAAIDIGTTTLAVRLYDLKTGKSLFFAGCENPQTSVSADVVGRIGAALFGRGAALRTLITEALEGLLTAGCREAGIPRGALASAVVTGNTAMLYLLTGRSPEALSHAPFRADCLFGMHEALLGLNAYLPPCMHAFVGADAVCAILASRMCEREETALLCDIGTNGEIALWKDGTLYVTSTAAGPAFEGAGISSGASARPRAIDGARVENGALSLHVLGGGKPDGLCGSGLLDVVAAGLTLGTILETGAMPDGDWTLSGPVALTRQDVRALQLAKAAIAAGMQSLLEEAGASVDEIRTLYLAGGFGSHLNGVSAAEIGLIPAALLPRLAVLGNAALRGAGMLLLDTSATGRCEALAKAAIHVDLGGNARFSAHFVDHMALSPDNWTPLSE